MKNLAWLVFATYFILEPKGHLWLWVGAFWVAFVWDGYWDWRDSHPKAEKAPI